MMPEVDAFNCDAYNTTIYRGGYQHSGVQKKTKIYEASCFEERFFKTPCYIPQKFPAPRFNSSFGTSKSCFRRVTQSPNLLKLQLSRCLH